MKLCVHLFSCVLLAKSFAQMKAPEGSIVKVADREVYVHAANYDKTKIPPYTLESPLKFVDGRPVTRETWNARREEILGILRGKCTVSRHRRPRSW